MTALIACGGISSTEVPPVPNATAVPAAPLSDLRTVVARLEATIAVLTAPTPTSLSALAPHSTPVPTQTKVTTTRDGNLIARVIRVVDGDTVSVSFLDGSTDTVRLLGVDTPEMFTANKANEYGNITDTVCLDR